MAVTLPKILIKFQQLAASFVQRSERGIAILILRDDTAGGNGYATYTDATELTDAPYTDANKQAITDAMSFGPLRVGVAKIGSTDELAAGLTLVTAQEKTGWITVVDGTSTDWTALVTWIKAREAEDKSWKAVVYNATAPDSMHVVNFVNTSVTFADARGQKTGSAYMPSLVGLLAACNVERGATNYLCSNLSRVEVPESPNTVVSAGKFILVNDDDEVRVGVDVNSLTTTDGKTKTEDMKYIETVEAMDLLRDDIARTFREDYMGQYRNSLTNQMLFISAVNYYFQQLAASDILDPEHENSVEVDVAAQRSAWLGTGKSEAAEWDDATVRSNTFKRTVYLAGDVKILGSMANLEFQVTLA